MKIEITERFKGFENIKEGQKITIVTSGNFGGISIVKTTFMNVTPEEYYVDCPADMVGIEIMHRPHRHRNTYILNMSYYSDFIVYDGWQDITTDCLYTTERRENGTEIRRSKYRSFDKQNFEEIKKTFPDSILFDSL